MFQFLGSLDLSANHAVILQQAHSDRVTGDTSLRERHGSEWRRAAPLKT
jgi:hypothetical protein